eukprot:6361989-Amphidinium_carterae.1
MNSLLWAIGNSNARASLNNHVPFQQSCWQYRETLAKFRVTPDPLIASYDIWGDMESGIRDRSVPFVQ